MKHPEVLLVPALMLADYFVAILSAVQREKGYSEHFKIERFELNSIWQKDIAARRWFSPRHIVATLLVALFLVFMTEYRVIDQDTVSSFMGFSVVYLGALLGRHLCNLLTFRYVARWSAEIDGQVRMDHRLVLSMSLYQYIAMAVPVILIAVVSPTSFAIGAAGGAVSLVACHFFWFGARQAPEAPPSSM